MILDSVIYLAFLSLVDWTTFVKSFLKEFAITSCCSLSYNFLYILSHGQFKAKLLHTLS